MKTKALLIASAAFEAGVGLALLVAPSLPALLLLGAELPTPAARVVGRVAGAALLALALACWTARHDAAPRAVVVALLFYNVATAILLVHAGLALGLAGLGLWPTIVLHAGMGAWCATCVSSPGRVPRG